MPFDISFDQAIDILGVALPSAGLFFVWLQLGGLREQIRLARAQAEKDHERSRRSTAAETARWFVDNIRVEHSKMMQLLEELPELEIRRLNDGKPISIPTELKEFAISALRVEFPEIEDRHGEVSDLILGHFESMHLRFIMLDLLNIIESCLIPWHLGISDESATISQFKPLVAEKNGSARMDTARRIVGYHKFPATLAFSEKIEVKTSAPLNPLTLND